MKFDCPPEERGHRYGVVSLCLNAGTSNFIISVITHAKVPIPMFRWLALSLILGALMVGEGRGQETTVTLFDEADAGGADYRDASAGLATGNDVLRLTGPGGDKLPLETTQAFSGTTSGVLEYRHTAGGAWELVVEADGAQPLDLAGFDSLVVYVNGPEALPGGEVPRVCLEDAQGERTTLVWMSTPRNVRVDAGGTGFTAESPTNAVLDARYANALPRDQRRPGYPEDLIVTFADVPLDTSLAAIGAPAIPAHFKIESEATGRPLDFSFRDLNSDSTLSADGEFIEVRLPEAEGDTRLHPTWRIAFDGVRGAGSLTPPGDGDVYRLAVSFEAFALDSDPGTWQRLSLPLIDFEARENLALAEVEAVCFTHGGLNPAVRTLWFDRITAVKNDDEAFLDFVQRATFDYFWQEANPANGLVKDRSRPNAVASIAAVGFGLSALTVGIDRGWITREEGRDRVHTTLTFFWNAPQSQATDATGYKGFFYHFLDMNTGRRAWTSELSTIDTALLMGGVLHMREYFTADDPVEESIRTLADAIYERVEWDWAQARPPAISHGWRPESGFIAFDWIGYNEAMLLYLLALGSPTHPVEPAAWTAWTSGYDWETHYDFSFVRFPPLFGHQYSHVWIDFRGIQDAYMRAKGIDYFENSRRATLAQRAYHIANPNGWPNYGRDEWGLTASDIPGGYRARGAPPAQNDDGTLAPTAPGGSIVFTPEESIAALRHMYSTYPDQLWGPYGFRDAYNIAENWFASDYLGIDQGPILLMIENYRTEAVWERFMEHEAVQHGLERAGFDIPTAIAGTNERPATPTLAPAFPNPFATQARIRYTLHKTVPVTVIVYNSLGRKVATLIDTVQPAGTHETTFDADALPSGLYFYTLHAGNVHATRSMIRVRF